MTEQEKIQAASTIEDGERIQLRQGSSNDRGNSLENQLNFI